MNRVNPYHREAVVIGPLSEVRDILKSRIRSLKGKIVQANDVSIECNFGSLLIARILGEFFVPRSTLPKTATLRLKNAGNRHTQITLAVRDAHRFGIKWGYVEKYEEALEELADAILANFRQLQNAKQS